VETKVLWQRRKAKENMSGLSVLNAVAEIIAQV
jgi:hypothetical protein